MSKVLGAWLRKKVLHIASVILGSIVIAIPAIVAGTLLIDKTRFSEQLLRIQEIQIGDSQANVMQRLGEPAARVPAGVRQLFGVFDKETWIYGRRKEIQLGSEFPFVVLTVYRFGPQSGDVSIEFDSEQKVSSVWRHKYLPSSQKSETIKDGRINIGEGNGDSHEWHLLKPKLF